MVWLASRWPLCLAVLAASLAAAHSLHDNWTVCVSDRPPISSCSVDQKNDSSKWASEGGFAVVLFKDVLSMSKARLGSAVQNVTYEFLCLDWTVTELLQELVKKPLRRQCDVVIGPITINSTRLGLGIKFSFPIAVLPLGTVVRGEEPSVNGLFWLQPFSAPLWAVLALTTFIFVPAVVIFLAASDMVRRTVEVEERGNIGMVQHWAQKYMFALFTGFAFFVPGGEMERDRGPRAVNSGWLARAIFYFGLGLVSLVLVAAYTANFSAVLVAPTVQTSITNPAQLYGQKVAMAQMNQELLQMRYDMIYEDANITTNASVIDDLHKVANQEWDAIVYDWPILVWGLHEYPDVNLEGDGGSCLALLSYTFLPRQIAFAFAKDFRSEYMDAMKAELVQMDDEGELADRRAAAWEEMASNGSLSTCKDNSGANELQLSQVWVLFVVFGGFGVAAIVLALISIVQTARATNSKALPIVPVFRALTA